MRVSVLLVLAALCFASVVVASASPLNAWPSDEIMPLLDLPKDLDIPVFESESKQSLMEVQAEQNMESQLDAEAEADSDAAAEAEVEAVADAAAEMEAAAEVEAETAADAAANQEVDAELATEAEAEADADADTETEAETEANAETEMEADLSAQVDAQTQAEAEAQVATDLAVDIQAEVLAGAELMTEAQVLAALKAKVAAGWSATIKGNGCGSGLTAKLVPDWNMLSACNTHDGCYDSCGVGKAYCDNNFYSNMLALCKSKYKANTLLNKICVAQAKVYYEAVKNFGKSAFENARNAKKCPMSATAAGVAPKKF